MVDQNKPGALENDKHRIKSVASIIAISHIRLTLHLKTVAKQLWSLLNSESHTLAHSMITLIHGAFPDEDSVLIQLNTARH